MDQDLRPADSGAEESSPWARLTDYFAGGMTPDEQAAMVRWIHAEPQRVAVVARLQAEWQATPSWRTPVDSAAAWTAFLERTGRVSTPDVRTRPRLVDVGRSARRPRITPQARGLSARWATFAGLAAVVLGVALWTATRSGFFGPSSSPRVEYASTRGQRLTIHLPDGTTVLLAPETKLTVQPDFGTSTRSVVLTGEAAFTVAPGEATPFMVRTGAVTTRVLGTEFTVRHYPHELATQVAVVTGKVSAGGLTPPVILTAGMMGRVFDSSAVLGTARDAETATSWIRGRLVFRDAPVAEMLAALERWYGYEFRLVDTTLLARHVSLALAINRPAEAMNMVKAILNVSMTFNGRIVTLRPEQTDTVDPRIKSRRTEFTTHELEVGK